MHERLRRIFRNTVTSFAGHALGNVAALLFLVAFARSFGAGVLGDFWYAMAVGSVMGIFVSRGTNTILVREIARQTETGPSFIGAASFLQLLIAALLFAGLIVLTPLIPLPEEARSILLIITGYQLLYSCGKVYHAYFSAREIFHYGAALEVGHKLVILGGGLTAIWLSTTPVSVLFVYPVAGALFLIAGYLLVARLSSPPPLTPDWRRNWQWTRAGFPLFLKTGVAMLLAKGGIIVLASFSGSDAVGLYAAAERLIMAAGLPFTMFAGAAFPVMVKLSENAREFGHFVRLCVRLSGVAAILGIGVVVILRDELIQLVYGDDFIASVPVLGLLALGVFNTAVNSLLSMSLVARDRLWWVLGTECLGLVVLFGVLFLVVDKVDAGGLAIAVLCAKVARTIALLAGIASAEMAMRVDDILLRLAAPVFAMAAVGYATSGGSFALSLPATLATGALAMILSGSVRKKDWQEAMKLLKPAGQAARAS